ncbi:MAG: sterol desaturase family protein [Candidatus Hermodarchaeota archaeon]
MPIVIIIYINSMILATIAMEGVAWFLHRYVMHGFGWYLHKDHHRPKGHGLQKNDTFAGIFSILSFVLIFFGASEFNLLFWLGIGVALYGIGYFGFHDVMFHKRIKNKYRPKSSYMKRIFKAHSYHHQTTNEKGPGNAFGFLYASKKYKVQ